MTTFLGENAIFTCSIREGDILWYVDDVYALGLPPEYGASFMSSLAADCIKSTLQIRAIEQTNNSQIKCSVGINLIVNQAYFPSTALLLIQGDHKNFNV